MTRRIGLLLVFLGLIALAAGCPATSTPTPVLTGVLKNASGSGAPLTLNDLPFQGGSGAGTDFIMTATLGTNLITNGPGPWQCFAPDPLQFASYGIQATDNENFGFFITVATTTGWTIGAHPIDGVNVTLLVVGPNSFGQATSGTLVLTAAPTPAPAGSTTDTGGTCAFYTSGAVLLFGYPD